MMTNNEQYVPVLIKDLVRLLDKSKKTSNDYNSALNVLIITKKYIDKALTKHDVRFKL